MKLWVIHPKYLDPKGLVALWREGLLARKVLKGKTKGWKNHPQLIKFKAHKTPVVAINTYLFYVWKEAERRGYNFDKRKIGKIFSNKKIKISKNEVVSDFEDLKNKLKIRNPEKYKKLLKLKEPEAIPLFIVKS